MARAWHGANVAAALGSEEEKEDEYSLPRAWLPDGQIRAIKPISLVSEWPSMSLPIRVIHPCDKSGTSRPNFLLFQSYRCPKTVSRKRPQGLRGKSFLHTGHDRL